MPARSADDYAVSHPTPGIGDRDAQPLRIAALIDCNHAYKRGILRGIRSFSHTRGNWVIDCSAPSANALTWLRRWRPAGVITIDGFESLYAFCRQQKMPFVQLLRGGSRPLRTHVTVDDRAIGRLAANYFLDRGFTHFAYAGFSNPIFSKDRREGFVEQLATRGMSCHVYGIPLAPGMDAEVRGHIVPLRPLQKWVTSLPKPLALFACNDVWGRELIEACIFSRIRVPNDVSIIGTDDDELWCSLSQPELSSVAVPWERIGRVGAELLQHILDGHKSARSSVAIPPTGVVTRGSSDSVAIQNPDLAAALRLVQQRAKEGLSVKAILREVPINRRAMERGFRKVMGRTPLQEILRLRLEAACTLLTETDLSLPMIADRVGFARKNFGPAFKRGIGTTPAFYRKRRHMGRTEPERGAAVVAR